MVEYIEREKAVQCSRDVARDFENDGEVDASNGAYTVGDWLAAIPAADVGPVVRGRWNRTDAYPHHLYCSVCYKTYLRNDEILERWEFPLNFCPNCGADMREGNEPKE